MLVVSQRMVEISKLKAQLDKTFQMKDQGEVRKNIGHRSTQRWEIWENIVEKILMRFSMNVVKSVNILFAFYRNIYSSLCPFYKEEKVMSRI